MIHKLAGPEAGMKPSQIKCPVCLKQITLKEMEDEIRTGVLTLMVEDGRLTHMVCLENVLVATA